jgi:hypothetical protein
MKHLRKLFIIGAALSIISLPSSGAAENEPVFVPSSAALVGGGSCPAVIPEDQPPRGPDADFTVVTEPTVLYASDFDTSESNWSLLSGNWQFDPGTLAQVEECDFDASALYDMHAVIDFRWEGTFTGETSNQGGLVINQQSVETRSGATLIDLADDGTKLRWGRYDDLGYYVYLGHVNIDRPANGENVTLTVEGHDKEVSITVNGTPIAAFTTVYGGGLVGLVATQSKVAFTSVTLTGLGSSIPVVEVPTLRTPLVDRMIFANTYVSTGDSSTVNGNVVAGTYVTTGLNGAVNGDILAGSITTLGATSPVSGDLRSGTSVTLGAGATVAGELQYGTAVVFGASATSGTQVQNTTVPNITATQQDVIAEQTALASMPADVVLPMGNIPTDVTFTAGVHNVAGLLTFTAGTTITLDALGQDSEFIFNIDNYLTFGAGVRVVVVNATANTSVTWNAPAGYITLGDGANIVGTILARTHVVVGANATVRGADTSCSGAVYAATSYVSIGAGATVGGIGTCGAP